jgi:phospholipid/cholesterol/gamma-HCH transport system substrate-binding protein
MQRSSLRDTVVGLFVLSGLAALAFLSVSVGGLGSRGPGGFQLFAHFDEIGGLKRRAQVAIAGVKVGEVRRITLGEDYRATVELDLDPAMELPLDTSASIVTSGLLGDQYLVLQLGGEEELLASGDTISFTEPALLLERLIGKLIHNTGVTEE